MAKLLARLMLPLKPKRRWAQFSLGALFLLVTVLCVVLNVWVAPAERQRQAVAAIEAHGAKVFYSHPDPKWGLPSLSPTAGVATAGEAFPKRFLRWLPRDYLDEVQGVDLDGSGAMDAQVIHLQGLTDLRTLSLARTRVTDDGLARLRGLTNLQALFLNHTRVTGAGITQLQGLTSLEWLDLWDTQLSDSDLVGLKGLTGLQWLHLGRTKITDAGLAHLEGMTTLRRLGLNDSRVTDAGLAHLHGLTGLEALFLDRTRVTAEGVAELRKALPNCKISGP